MTEMPQDLYEFHEVISHMQDVEETVIDGHRDLVKVSKNSKLFPEDRAARRQLQTKIIPY
jgi:hypothetical protein